MQFDFPICLHAQFVTPLETGRREACRSLLFGVVLVESIVVALIGGAVTLTGVIASNSRSRAVLEQKVDELSRRVEKHNCLVERTYRLERDVSLVKRDVESLEERGAR